MTKNFKNEIVKIVVKKDGSIKLQEIIQVSHFNNGGIDDGGVESSAATRVHFKIKVRAGATPQYFPSNPALALTLPQPIGGDTFTNLTRRGDQHISVDLKNMNPQEVYANWYKYTIVLQEVGTGSTSNPNGPTTTIDPMIENMCED